VLEVRLPKAVTVAEELVVVGRLSDYVDTSAGAARTSAALIDIPQAIVVLPARLIADIGALDTKDLYKFISGVKGNPCGSFEGDVNNSGFSTSQFRLSNLERVEVLKGPSSVLYGSGEPGGIINHVTKKPRDTFAATATVGTGQYGQALVEGEVTGPANASKTLLYRGAAYFEDRDSFRNNASMRNLHLVGGLAWKPSARTAPGLEFEHIDQTNTAHRLRGVPVNAAGDFLADYRWTASEPTDFTDLVANVWQARYDQALGRAGGARVVAAAAGDAATNARGRRPDRPRRLSGLPRFGRGVSRAAETALLSSHLHRCHGGRGRLVSGPPASAS